LLFAYLILNTRSPSLLFIPFFRQISENIFQYFPVNICLEIYPNLVNGNVERRMGTASRHRFELGRVRCVLLKGSPQELQLTQGHKISRRTAQS
jgi:hypothetical protein